MAAQLINVPVSYIQNLHDEFEKRRDVLYEGMKQIPVWSFPNLKGHFIR